MSMHMDRRELLQKFAWGSVFVGIGAGGAVTSIVPAWAQNPASGAGPRDAAAGRAGVPRITYVRAPLTNGIIVHAGATSMELYHQHPHDPREEVVQPEDIRLQTRLVMRNHKEILDWIGLDWNNVVKLVLYPTRMEELPQIEEVLASYFKDWWPAMTAVHVNGLSSPQARLEIDMWVVPNETNPVAG